MSLRSIGSAAFLVIGALVVSAAPAGAMHWIIYAPDEASYRYWMDKDSVAQQGDYTFVTYVLGGPDSTAPTTTDGERIGINCKTGDSVRVRNGEQIPGPHFTDQAYLFNAICPSGK